MYMCMVNPQCKFSVRTVTTQNYAPYPGTEICHDVGVVSEPYHPHLPISVSTCAKDPVARFACLCDGYAMGPSVFPPWF